MNAEKLTGRPDYEELEMIRDSIMFPHLITMMQKSIDDMSLVHVSLKNVIVRCQEHILFAISEDYRKLRQEFRRRGIKVVEEGIRDEILYFRYFCRGYDEGFGIVRESLRTEVVLKLTEYTNDLGMQLKKKRPPVTTTEQLTH